MPALRFRQDRTFTIAQFTDLHIHDQDDEHHRTIALIEDVLDKEAPDMVVLTGDVIAGSMCHDPREAFQRAAQPMIARGIPWAAVFGNHDDEGTHSRHDLMEAQQQLPYCLSMAGPADVPGVGNFYLTVQKTGITNRAEAGAVLYFLDSGSYAKQNMGVGGYAWIEPKQVDWYRNTATQLGQHTEDRMPALAFFHIPLPEYNIVWDMERAVGEKNEDVCSPVHNSGMFLNMVDIGDVLGTFVGHDHTNDFDGMLAGIRLCYGRASGYGTYGKEGFQRGARLIKLREKVFSFDTWLRLQDGTVVRYDHPKEGR